MKIDITEEDIKNAKLNDPDQCPIALASSRITKKQCSVYPSWRNSGILYIHDVQTGLTIGAALPATVNRKALIFDSGGAIEPFDFELNIQ